MPTIIISMVALCSTTAFLVLWFLVVRKELRGTLSMMESARNQLSVCKKNQANSRDDPDATMSKAVYDRSMDIYCQSVKIYHRTLHKPWNYLPGRLMGFREVNGET